MSEPVPILIAEDSRTQAELLRHLLESQGYQVIAAPDGAQALAAARVPGQRPALVLSDVEMPAMTGYQMCRAIKDDPDLRGIPVILLTSLSDAADVLRGLEAGADYYLTKPFDPEYLLGRVRAILESRRATGDAAVADEACEPPLELNLDGRPLTVTASRRQALNLLLSTYGNAVQRNQELIRAERRLQEQNTLLQATARSEKQAHDALKQAQSQLVQSEKLAGLGQMVAGIAHEINNPLAFVGNNIAVLQRDVGALAKVLELYGAAEAALGASEKGTEALAPVRELAGRIDVPYTLSNLQDILTRSREGVRRIQQIVKDLRDFARLDEGDLTEADVNAGVESSVQMIGSKARDRQVQIALEPGALPPLTCYPAKINQVVMNLLANAIEASNPGGQVTVRTAADNGEVRIEVADTGHGIDPAIRERIFDPFFTTKPVGQGTGLGLSISYGIIREHAGSIDVDSTPGQGSRFTVRLPLRKATT